MTESEGGSEREGSGAGGSRGHLDSAEGGHGCTCRSLSSSATRAALKWAARAVPCCQERAAAGQAGTWEGRVGDGQILTSAECMREQCAWACNAVEGTLPKHPGNWGTGPSQEAQGVLQPQQVQSLPRSPQHIQPWQPSLHLPRTALTSYSLRKPMCDLAAF